MTRIDVAFTPAAATERATLDVAIVVDVLRMTTTAVTLFARGLRELAVIAGEQEARTRADATGALLLGEREGVALPGFDGGNSPVAYLHASLAGRCAILCTTNGSGAVEAVSQARSVLLGAIVNGQAVAQRALDFAPRHVLVVCAGTHGRVSLDDVAGAGWIVRALLCAGGEHELSDAAEVAVAVAGREDGLEAVLRSARHARVLSHLGFEADVAYAARADLLTHVPLLYRRAPPRFVDGGER